jgi:signal transduction histidine kinase
MLQWLYRPVLLPAALSVGLLLLTLGLLLAMSWSSLERLQPVHRDLRDLNRLQETALAVQAIFTDSLSQDVPVAPARLSDLYQGVDELLTHDDSLLPSTRRYLQQARQALAAPVSEPRQALLATLTAIRAALADEIGAHDRMLAQVRSANQLEFHISVLAISAFPVLLAMILYLLRKRIVVPLHNLGAFMALLAQRDYSQVPTTDVDPLLLPLFEHYNRMVSRLAELEREHQAHRQSLESAVRTATQALLEHQRELANAERLAAVGEVAAGVAHELRNPLAGIQMALSNLRRQLTNAEQVSRLDATLQELKRVNRLLNTLLDQARQAPEPLLELALAEQVASLLELARYQVPLPIRLEQTIAADLRWRLPPGRLRQALLNLISNAVQSLAEQAGVITVSADRVGDNLRLAVCDDGPGFPPELLQNGVRPFATWREGGTGLGLALVRRFAHDLGGDLKLTNRVPRGACVIMELPRGDGDG